MKTVQGEPVIWRWIVLLILFSVMIWGILEIAASSPQSPAEKIEAPAADASASSKTLDEDPAGH